MELTFECPNCRMIDHTDRVESAARALCRHCHAERDLHAGSFDADGAPVGCPLCGSADLFARKDFPQGLGLSIVVAGFAAASAFWYHGMPLPAYLVLGAALLIDAFLYRWMPDVAVCYGCGGQLRGPGVNRGGRFRSFDASVADRHRRGRPGLGPAPAPAPVPTEGAPAAPDGP